jgi:hypothetical protein
MSIVLITENVIPFAIGVGSEKESTLSRSPAFRRQLRWRSERTGCPLREKDIRLLLCLIVVAALSSGRLRCRYRTGHSSVTK